MKTHTPIFFLIAFLITFTLSACTAQPAPDLLEPIDLTIKDQTYSLELAVTPQARFQGLSDRKSMPDNQGMLFVFPYPMQTYFVMRRCYFPIDIIFLDASGRITATHKMKVVPIDTPENDLPRYSSRYPAQFAIELHGGQLQKLNLKDGDLIQLPIQSLKKLAK
ncbi:DUF192 domain-containing protein [Planctomycetota bacterium]|nr:DUF192 domain-containing protein [Planctomycetota bacterium]